jgi:hypothetical protein
LYLAVAEVGHDQLDDCFNDTVAGECLGKGQNGVEFSDCSTPGSKNCVIVCGCLPAEPTCFSDFISSWLALC